MPIIINMIKARSIQMDKIREERNKALLVLDIEFIRALEAGNASHKVIADEKQSLRDIPQTFDLSAYPDSESLANAWPSYLNKPLEL